MKKLVGAMLVLGALLVFSGCFGCDDSGEVYEPPAVGTYDEVDWETALDEFLGEFLPIFTSRTPGSTWDDGWFRFVRELDENEILPDGREVSLAFYDPVTDVRIDESDVPFVRERNFIATDFRLYDFNDDGVPEVVITFGIPQTGSMFHVLYAFVGGEFREIGFAGTSFYRDAEGNLITESSEPGDAAYFHFEFDGRSAWVNELLIEGSFDDERIVEFHAALTPIERLSGLEQSVMASVSERLLAEGRVE